jgi:hypothetical protein
MATFGSFPGVRVSTTGGAVAGAEIGRTQKDIIVGLGDGSGSADAGEVYQINSRSDADDLFGPDSQLAEQYRLARGAGANPAFIYGATPALTEHTFTDSGTATGTLQNTPVVTDSQHFTATDTTNSTELSVHFSYESSVSAPSSDASINVNPVTGEWALKNSTDVEIVYNVGDYAGAISAADAEVNEDEFAHITLLSKIESHVSSLATTVSSMREKYKMVTGSAGAEPTGLGSDGYPRIDTGSYSDAVDQDTIFLFAPTTSADGTSLLGALGGKIAGNALDEPIYDNPVNGFTGMAQSLSKAEANELRDAQVIPIRDQGTISIADNRSTSTATDFERDLFRRRIVDLVILTAKTVGENIIGFINDPETRSDAQQAISDELEQIADDGLIKPNLEQETNFFVEVTKNDADTVGIDLGITPFGLVKRVEVTLTVDT